MFFPWSKMANKFPICSVCTSWVQEPKPEDHLGLPLEPSKPEHDYGMYKKLLHQYAQKSGLPLPVYKIENEGFPHAPKFRSSVFIDETKFTSKFTFPDRRAAEQDVAKLAYETIVKDNKTLTGGPHIYQNLRFCKLILSEYATKTGLGVPEYNTTLAEGTPHPVFVSSFVLGGKSYTGQVGRSRKEAEQLVAQLAIQSLLGSDSGKLTEIIKSKERLFATVDAKKNSGTLEITVE
ncbi:double-stranded RNA-binding protein 4-like isoform X1 [Coffea arabica]|uniref:Double-stranded RNA-binding protein 4-like isoform X1 n=2 Tax=Coffea arabica TaxID=13443 RepID=A0A6P6XDK5_COFAR|nr:double-stranded RNA-binding protein 4-like [Coffea arabica]XP_027125884.1 double-stranded RNA-binding protein 4-like [Coffea arabica]